MSLERVRRVLARMRGEELPKVVAVDREKGWMGTSTGRKFWPLAPRAADVDVRDVARGLAMTCRYGGQVRAYYSVAEHCVHVSRYVPPEYALEALLHDSAEAYIGDMVRPLKHTDAMVEFRRAEAAIERCVFEALGITSTPASHAVVKSVDDRILVDEITWLVFDPSMYLSGWLGKLEPLGVDLQYWDPVTAEQMFLRRWEEVRRG